MANYIPRWRTNYFKVKDEAKFQAWVDSFYSECEIATREDDMQTGEEHEKWFMLYSTGETGVPYSREQTAEEAEDWLVNHPDLVDPDMSDEENVQQVRENEEMEMEFYIELSEHLTDDCVACGIEIGYEKMRYLTGVVAVVDSSGDVEYESLGNWADKKAKEMWPDKVCTDCSY